MINHLRLHLLILIVILEYGLAHHNPLLRNHKILAAEEQEEQEEVALHLLQEDVLETYKTNINNQLKNPTTQIW